MDGFMVEVVVNGGLRFEGEGVGEGVEEGEGDFAALCGDEGEQKGEEEGESVHLGSGFGGKMERRGDLE